MVGITFARPVGPYADTKELEYISSLHQTGKSSIRQDGTINAKDVMYFLCSRHGIRVDEGVVSQAIIEQLAGTMPVASDDDERPGEKALKVASGDNINNNDSAQQQEGLQKKQDSYSDEDDEGDDDEDDDNEPRMDLCQVLAMLVIPFLRGGNSDGDEHEAVGKVVDIALESIWAELRAHSVHVPDKEKEEGVLITMDFLREIMDMFGEFNLPDDILQEMIHTASGNKNQTSPQFYMTKASFLQALTADTQLWKPSVDQTKSTHFDDARHAWENKVLLDEKAKRREEAAAKDGGSDAVEDPIPRKSKENPLENDKNKAYPFTQLYTAANIDNNADTYRSTAWFVLVWTSTVWIYLAYISGFDHKTDRLPGCNYKFGCDIALALVNWLNIAAELMFYGFIWIMWANLGNDTRPTDTIKQKLGTSFRVLWAMFLVVVTTVLSYFYEIESDFYNTVKYDNFEGAYVIVLVLGLCILLLQAGRFFSIYVSLGPFTKGSQEDKERRTKLAASSKTLKFIEHATLLHVSPDDEAATVKSSLTKSTVSESVTELSRKLHASSKARNSGTKSKGSSTSTVLLNYSHMQDYEEESGGILWTWKSLWSGSLLNEEGIYLHGRLLAVNTVQFLICFFLIGYIVTLLRYFESFIEPEDDGCSVRVDGILVSSEGSSLLEELGAFYNNATEFWENLEGNNFTLDNASLDLMGNLTEQSEELWNVTGGVEGLWNSTLDGFREIVFNLNTTHFGDKFGNIYEGQFPVWNGTAFSNGALTVCYDFYITNGTDVWENDAAITNSVKEQLGLEHWEYTTAFAFGLIAAIFAALSISLIYIPSFVSWVLKYRSGFVPSLKGNMMTYLMYRKSPDQTAIIWGSAFWGILASSGIVFVLFGSITFVLVWDVTRQYLKTVISQYLGIAATITIKVVIMMLLRNSFYAGGYYRKRPAASNMMNVLLEAWNLGLSIGTVTSRVIHLIVVTCFYIGRIDTPMLAPGVSNVGGTNLDPSPDAFRKDLLIHEAHRHPFLERLGLLYLLKLFNGKDFGTRAGAYWRILFVLAIFPWMRNYRLSRTAANLLTELEAEQAELSEILEEEQEETNQDKNMEGSGRLPAGKLWDASDSVETLAAKRRALKAQLRDLNMLLSQKLDDADASHTLQKNKLMGAKSIRNLRGVDA